jgi:putative membrane protein
MYPNYYGGGYDMGMNAGFGLFGLIFHVIGLILLILFVVWLIRMFGGGRGRRRWMWHTHSALSILSERFAKGEIDQKEYEERKKALLGEMK